jgi:hypothetical protein
MLVISGGVRTDTGWRYQVHQIDLHQFMKGLTKATFRIDRHEDIASTIFRAYDIATSDEPGSVFLERVKRVQRSCRRLAMESSGRVNLLPWPRVPRCPRRAIAMRHFVRRQPMPIPRVGRVHSPRPCHSVRDRTVRPQSSGLGEALGTRGDGTPLAASVIV